MSREPPNLDQKTPLVSIEPVAPYNAKRKSPPKSSQFQVQVERIESNCRPNHRMIYSCHLCSTTSTSACVLNCHLQRNHSLFTCVECKLLFPDRQRLDEHDKLLHNGEFMCEICGRVLETKRKYNGHRRNHREKTASCYYCGLTVEPPVQMMLHVAEYHKDTSRFTCYRCNYQPDFTCRTDLLAHRRECIIDPLQCSICKLFFPSPQELLLHEDYHTKRQLYYHCDICGNVSIAAPQLQRHLREKHHLFCPDSLVEAYSMTFPQLEIRRKQPYDEEKARKQMFEYVSISRRVQVTVIPTPAIEIKKEMAKFNGKTKRDFKRMTDTIKNTGSKKKRVDRAREGNSVPEIKDIIIGSKSLDKQ